VLVNLLREKLKFVACGENYIFGANTNAREFVVLKICEFHQNQ
jgi:hypothetical protein